LVATVRSISTVSVLSLSKLAPFLCPIVYFLVVILRGSVQHRLHPGQYSFRSLSTRSHPNIDLGLLWFAGFGLFCKLQDQEPNRAERKSTFPHVASREIRDRSGEIRTKVVSGTGVAKSGTGVAARGQGTDPGVSP
jgi:hypothetical protein